jgi:hypothetical protein
LIHKHHPDIAQYKKVHHCEVGRAGIGWGSIKKEVCLPTREPQTFFNAIVVDATPKPNKRHNENIQSIMRMI